MDRLRSVFEGMFDGVWLIDDRGHTTYANAAMANLLATTQAEMIGRPLTDYLDAGLLDVAESFLRRQPTLSGERIELRMRRADGDDLFGLVAGSPISTLNGTFVGTMLNVSDMTGKRALDTQLVQRQRLEAVGQFAGGIAHDFNNLLTSIRGYAELVAAGLPPDHPGRPDVDQIIVSADMAASIVRTLMAFSRHQVLVPLDVDPGSIVTGLVPMLGPLLGDDVRLELDIAMRHAWVRVDPTQFEQVIVNLALNARDAMPQGGTVRIGVHDLARTDPERPDPDRTRGPFVRVSVTDTGTGMDDATRARIFDPFFTTKGPGGGTGLGLSTVFGIVTQSGGQIHVETSPGHGTTFLVDLPRAASGPRPTPVAPGLTGNASAPVGTGVVLIVEDDPAVRRYARRILETAGYAVIEAMDGDQGLLESASWPADIDVLLTDITMPGLPGRQLAERIRVSRPQISVVFMSGHAGSADDRDHAIGAAGRFLQKPFTAAALRDAVGHAMGTDAVAGDSAT
ncbi:MAG: ATP-binding protein [Chloroflexota bacterium]